MKLLIDVPEQVVENLLALAMRRGFKRADGRQENRVRWTHRERCEALTFLLRWLDREGA